MALPDAKRKLSIRSGSLHSINSHPDGPYLMSTLHLPTDGGTLDDFDVDEDDSPYEEVRASVSNTDDPDMPVLTFRMWFAGLFLTMGCSAVNTFFNFRNPQIYLLSLPVVLLAYPLGKALALVLPITQYHLPKWLGGGKFSLNPGPWNIKEHACIYIMANVAIYPSYSLNLIVVNEHWYNNHWGVGFNYTLAIAGHLTGFGLAGLCKRILVKPASLVWPQTLITSTLLNTLHAEDDSIQSGPSTGVTRYKWFVWVACSAFVWQWFPGYLFTGLSTFSWVCLMAPKSKVVNQLFGTNTGLGLSALSFDWNQIAWIGSPLMIPWWAEVHIFIGFLINWWIILPILYYTNVWNLAHFPINSSSSFDRFGKVYNVTRVLTPEKLLNVEEYESYSTLYLTAPYVVLYLTTFAMTACIITHTVLHHGVTLWNAFRGIDTEPEDVHARLMKAYPEVPRWWYYFIIAFFFLMAVVAVERWPTNVPVYSLVIALLIPAIYLLPSGLIFAVTGQNLYTNLVVQVIPGAMLPGNPLGNMVFKSYSIETLNVALLFTQDLKLGHYLKIPPRASFWIQVVSTILCVTVQIAVKEWIFATTSDICSPTQPERLTCPRNRVFFTASAVWGLIGPVRQFGPEGTYGPMVWALLFGALLPVPFWLWQRRFPNSRVKFVNLPVMLNGPTYAPPASGINYASWFLVGFIFQRLIRARNFRWWSKFNYITSAALDSGTVLSVLFIFLSLQLTKGELKWWGNNWFNQTLDAIGTGTPYALRDTSPEGFAPSLVERRAAAGG